MAKAVTATTLRTLSRRQSSGSLGSIEESLSVWAQKMTHASSSLAAALTSGRHYIGDDWWSGEHDTHCAYDPRFLLFEYNFDLLLRPRQVEICRTLLALTLMPNP